MISKRSKMALKPYLEAITLVCENLSKEKYNRFSAFRSEVMSVVNSSGLLNKLAF